MLTGSTGGIGGDRCSQGESPAGYGEPEDGERAGEGDGEDHIWSAEGDSGAQG